MNTARPFNRLEEVRERALARIPKRLPRLARPLGATVGLEAGHPASIGNSWRLLKTLPSAVGLPSEHSCEILSCRSGTQRGIETCKAGESPEGFVRCQRRGEL